MMLTTKIWKTLGPMTLRQGPAAAPPKGKRPMQIMSNRTADNRNGSAGQVSLMGGRVSEKAALVTTELAFHFAVLWVQAQNNLAGNGSGMWSWSMKRRGSRWNSQLHCKKSGSYAVVRLG